MWLIGVLIVVGALLLMAELVLLPGLTVAGILSLASYCAASYLAYASWGIQGVGVVVAIIAVISVITIWLSLRAKTWRKFSLGNKIEGSSQSSPDKRVKIGERGVTITRLAPMGKVMIGGQSYEAKSFDIFVDQRTEVEVTGFENFNVIVKPINE
jgi:membrane-bound ClpP family serine protease